ncbi:MAG: CDP-diacylglycerol--glycerol-3-phosphate 3-phosphatidyltransferase [Vicinamibacterales bacterium]
MAHINLPNAITLTRIFLVPLLVVVLLTRFQPPLVLGVPRDVLGAAIFAVASLTDWLDGFVARRRKQVTPLGQMLDPLADKLLTAAAFISLVQMGLAPAWMVAVIVGREIAVTGLRSLAYARGGSLVASPLGKTKMVAQVVAILALILGRNNGELFVAGQAALWVVLVAAVVSAVDYYRRFTRALAAAPPDRAASPSSPSAS